MLVNGKEVFNNYNLTPIQAYNVQSQINVVPEINSDDKSDAIVSNGAIESSKDKDGVFDPTQSYSIGMFETIGSPSAKRSVRSREQYYETYIKMGRLGLVKRALDTISDEATQKNDDNEVLFINSNNEKIYGILRELFYDKLSINTELWSIVNETLKMGDNFYEVAPNVKDHMITGISRLKYVDPSKIEAHEKDGKIDYYVYKTNNKGTQLEQRLFPWQIVHFKLDDKETKPYGKSLLYSGIRSYERLTATEDIFLTYVISRTPSRRVFKIDVGGLPALEAQRAIREIRDSYRSQQVIDNEGNLNQISSILSITSDIFIPTRDGQSGTQIETLQGDAMNMNQNMTFLDNFKKDLLASFNIPAEYLGESIQNGNADRSTTLSQKDIKFGRFVERIQEQIIKVLYKVATLELFFNGFKGDDLKDFTLELTPPSTVKEASETGLLDTKINLISSMKNLDMFPNNWLLKRVLRLSDREISEINFMKLIEQKEAQQQQMGAAGMPGNIPMGGGAGMDLETPTEIGNEVPPAEGGEEPAAPEAGEIETPAPAEGGEEQLNQDVSYLNVDGQKFLIEDKDDFAYLISYIKEQKKHRRESDSEFLTEAANLGKKKPTKHKKGKNPFTFMDTSNEFGGINLKTGRISYANDTLGIFKS